MNDDIAIARRLGRLREADAESRCDRRAALVHVDELDVTAGHLSRQPRGQTTDRSPADDGHAMADEDVRLFETGL